MALSGQDKDDESLALLDKAIETYNEATKEDAEGFSEDEKKEIKDFLYYLFLEKGKIFYENNDYKAALTVYEKALSDFPDGRENDWTMYRMAMTYEELGEEKKAVETYQNLQSRYGATYWGEQARWRLKNIRWNEDYGKKAKEIGDRNE